MESAYPFIFVFLLALYFLPLLVAINRHHTNCAAIGILNLLLGWAVLGWVGALYGRSLHSQQQPRKQRRTEQQRQHWKKMAGKISLHLRTT